MNSQPSSLDRRANVVAAATVATVVLLLGFGSGIGAVINRRTASSVAGAASPAPTAAATRVAGATSEVVAAGSRAMTPMPSATGPRAAGPATTARQPEAATIAVPTSGARTRAGASGQAAGCTGQVVVDAMAEPFIAHLGKAHLEESPGQQAADLLDVDRYVQTHTVLAESMVGPAFDTGLASLGGIDPFISHVNKAHLEESPGQQAADVLDVDRYVQTHTVLAESMVAPAGEAATAAGC